MELAAWSSTPSTATPTWTAGSVYIQRMDLCSCSEAWTGRRQPGITFQSLLQSSIIPIRAAMFRSTSAYWISTTTLPPSPLSMKPLSVRGRRLIRLAPEGTHRSNFTVRDNKDNTAGILTRRASYSRLQQSVYLVPVVISDGDYPIQSSTGTLTVRVCPCDREGNMELCKAEALSSSPALSTAALIAILLCAVILLMVLILFTALKRQRKREPLIVSKEDVRDNVVSYNDEGGGEEDTQAFDIGALRHPDAATSLEESTKQRRDIMPTEARLYSPQHILTVAPVSVASRDNSDVRSFIHHKVLENDCNLTAAPYDSLATFAFEGAGSVAESLSSLGSGSSEAEQDYHYLSDWGPRFRRLADLYGAED
ncbi:cadherin-6-like isoform X5 [Clinocottus analis]|uniref:cadherin-6-like isoform X5 n=2 Tax=Clinocottus analis TaxID=304258 RepID=UPI0035C1B732